MDKIEEVKKILDRPIDCIQGMKRASEGTRWYLTEPYQDKLLEQIRQLFEPKPDDKISHYELPSVAKARLTEKEIDVILENKWSHDFTKRAMPRLVEALLEAQQQKDFSTVIKGGICPVCSGLSKDFHPDIKSGFMVLCQACKGTGRTPPVTVMDAIEKVMNEKNINE